MNAAVSRTQDLPGRRPTGGSLARAARRALVGGVVAVAVVTGVGTQTASADAILGGGGTNVNTSTSGTPSAVYRAVVCRSNWSGNGSITVAPFVTVQAGEKNGQYVTYRYNLQGSNGFNGTSGWSGAKWIPFQSGSSTYAYTMLPAGSEAAGHGVNWRVQVQVGWYTSAGWRYGAWGEPMSYDHGTSSGVAYDNCLT